MVQAEQTLIGCGQGRLLGDVQMRHAPALDHARHALLEKIVEGALDELGSVRDAGLLLQDGVILVEICRDGRRPCRQIVRQQSWAPAAPIERLAANAVSLADEIYVA